jgi:hypothetical protein
VLIATELLKKNIMKTYKVKIADSEIEIKQDDDGLFIKPDIMLATSGIGSALKPAVEPITIARKPISEKTLVDNFVKWGVGGINIDGCRVEAQGKDLDKLNSEWDREWSVDYSDYADKVGGSAGFNMDKAKKENAGLTGRFPANLCWTCSCEPHYLTGSVLFDILNIISNQIKLCLLKNSSSNVQSVEKKKSLQDMTSEEKMLCFAVENVDTPTLERILGKTLEVIFNEDTECSVEMLEKSMNTSLSISLSGNEKMEEYQKVLKYITLTATNLITELKTYKLSQSQIIGSFITKVISGIQEQSQVKSHSPNCEVVELFPNTKPTKPHGGDGGKLDTQNMGWGFKRMPCDLSDNGGSAARFFYCAKSSKSERNVGCEGLEEKNINERKDGGKSLVEVSGKKASNFHPTVKPISLMEYLIKLVSREGHTVLDPFAGSFTTGIACINLDRKFIGIERDKEYFKIGKARIDYVIKKKSSSLFSYDKTGKEE